MQPSPEVQERLYRFLTDEGEERSCEAISEAACQESPGNFLASILSGACSKVAEQIASPGTTLPYLLASIGAPAAFSGALVPIKDAGSLLPQLFVAAKIRAFARRKYFWLVPSFLQGLLLLLMAWSIATLTGTAAGLSVLGLLLLYSICSGVASIAFKDVTAKTISKGKRGQLLAWRSSLGSLLSLPIGLYLMRDLGEDSDSSLFVYLLIAAAACWFLSVLAFSRINEAPGANAGGRKPMEEARKAWKFWQEDADLRRFIYTRGLLMAIPLAQPFFVLLGKETLGGGVADLGLLVVAAGIAGILSSPFWGRFADRDAKALIRGISLLGIACILLMISFPFWPEALQNRYTFSALFLSLVMTHGGARLSRKTYLVDFAPEQERPSYVALSNTLIGAFTLVAAALGTLASVFSVSVMLAIYALLLGLAFLLAGKLREV
ncbi:MAG: MFS transporter [Nitritalea sp.]